MIKYVVAGMMVLGFASFAQANEGGACAKDRETLCAGVEAGGGKIAKCMKENQDKLSSECKAHMEKAKEAMKDMKEACHDDVEKFCGDVKPGKGRIMKCMKEHKEELSAACKEEIASAKEMRKKRK
ncbi:cysteine rich repeat-containing protein [Bdellovibrio sp. HCB117]|uniref:cysteine rich repeat-containing protein n=1 Tax=Bdellovibrio sp. HCB117 TaxID=3394359 RepID=UPI0039B6E67B